MIRLRSCILGEKDHKGEHGLDVNPKVNLKVR